MFELYEELIEQVQTLEAENIPYALVGGVGFSLLVHPRATEDTDFLIYPDDWERVKTALRPLGWLYLAGPMDFKNISIRRLTKIADADVMVSDFLLANDITAPGIDKAESLTFRNQPLKVAPPETIIALKQGRNSAKDQEDIRLLQQLIEERES